MTGAELTERRDNIAQQLQAEQQKVNDATVNVHRLGGALALCNQMIEEAAKAAEAAAPHEVEDDDGEDQDN